MALKIAIGLFAGFLMLWPRAAFAERECDCEDAITDAISDYIAENGSPEDNQEQGRAEVCDRVLKLNPKVFAQLVQDDLCEKPIPANPHKWRAEH